ARDRREATLAGVPAFPERGQRRAPRSAPVPTPRPALPPPPPAKASATPDRLAAFALAPAPTVAVVQVNALVNSPLFARIKECLPHGFARMSEETQKLGIELERDVDRIAYAGDAVAMSGFFEG